MTLARSLAKRIRSSLKRRAKHALRAVGLYSEGPAPTPEPAPPPVAPAPVEAEPIAVAAAPEPEGPPEPPAQESSGLSHDAVEELLEDMVRPALQADGGDITLVRVEPQGDVYVELVGACSSCPSATITMRQGIEAAIRRRAARISKPRRGERNGRSPDRLSLTESSWTSQPWPRSTPAC